MRQTARATSSSSSYGRQRRSKAQTPSSASRRLVTGTAESRPHSVLYLQPNHAKFRAPSKKESVFFDECNREIISLTSSFEQTNKTRVVFQKTDKVDRVEFLLPVDKRILSIKLNSTRTVLAHHVERNIIEFFNISQVLDSENQPQCSLDSKRYVQSSRAKNSKLIGFLWTGSTELVMITDLSIEYYHLSANRCRLNLVKMFQSATNWFVFQPPISNNRNDDCDTADPLGESTQSSSGGGYSILMVSTGSLGNLMQPYMFTGGRVVKLQKFEVEGSWHDNEKLELYERSVTIGHIYGYVRLLVLQHEILNVKSRGAQIVLYTVDIESGTTSKTHTLDLDINGRFAINILDNLVVAHDQPSKTSFIFDIMIQSTEKSDCPNHFVSLIDSLPIRPELADDGGPIEMYSLNWVFFQPNFIVDAKLGLLTTLRLELNVLQKIVQDNNLLLSFLAHRKNSEPVILKKCKEIVTDAYHQLASESNQMLASPLADVSSAFEILGNLVISAPELVVTGNKTSIPNSVSSSGGSAGGSGGSSDGPGTFRNGIRAQQSLANVAASIYQEDVHREVFRDFCSDQLEQPARYHFVTSTLLELIFVIRRHEKNVEFCLYEQLLKCMMRAKRYFQIIQMIRAEIFVDSKQLACLLLSMKDQYRPAGQLGLDMFHRLPGGLPANMPPELMQEY